MIGAVYFVTDPTADRPVIDQVMAAARGGAWAVQIRDKSAPDAEIASLVRKVQPDLSALGVRLFVNDRIAVSAGTGTDLHIGQGDGDPERSRAEIGSEALLGLSVETEAQCAAIPEGVDYIGAGPYRATPTKPDAAAPIGAAGLARIVAASSVPVVAIGGLGAADIPALKRAGAAGLAVVSAIARATDAEAATRHLVDAWRRA
ncbi:Thiamine-phosphate synthase [Roseivivax sp. THAF40]|uniref:thiamine phosphate synthase n=1 Tax=unclassified Roseivivax TaxID=2639302 RepID=UPI001267A693|nr:MULTISPECIES: thiamine phosphate synthase [unclassified Roseivivax]QFS83776.1 Thiamine-phosphate synthase [Roseivivax sp. THAF197b]QFT47608.1 Thiamine-phosphate synthase [Roseivivax sp. THAF40]